MAELSGKKVAILVEKLYEDLELWYPLYRLREAGAEVHVVGPHTGSFESKHGYPVKADLAAGEVRAADFDAVIIPGGYAPDHMRRHQAMVELVRASAQQGKVVAAICHGGWMLASAGVLAGKKVTGFRAIRDDLVHAGAQYLDQAVVRDGNLVTSRVPDDLPVFCRTIIAALTE
jgi:protease I